MLIIPSGSKSALDDYFSASSVEEALAYLVTHRDEAQLLAGGTDLMPRLQRGENTPRRLVDVSRICNLRRINREGNYVIIGGAVTLATLAQHEMIRQFSPLLCEAASQMATPQVRHLATLAGNVATAWGSAPGSVALTALDAEAEIANFTGLQWLPVESLFVRSGVSRIDSGAEMITAFRFRPLQADQVTSWGRIAPSSRGERSPLALAMLLTLEPDHRTISWATISLGWEHATPTHVVEAETELGGRSLDDVRARETLAKILAEHLTQLAKQVEAKPSFSRQAFTTLVKQVYDRACVNTPIVEREVAYAGAQI